MISGHLSSGQVILLIFIDTLDYGFDNPLDRLHRIETLHTFLPLFHVWALRH